MQAKTGVDAETTTSRRPPLAELPKQRLQGGSDAKDVVVVRPKRLRLSPEKLNGGEGRGGKDDAFKKLNGACMRRRHWSVRRPKAFASTSIPLQSRGLNNATATQESPPAATRSSRQEGPSETTACPGAGQRASAAGGGGAETRAATVAAAIVRR